ncbi:hypothetical protein Pmani_025481, partial [Petrolisthes manimaculis]
PSSVLRFSPRQCPVTLAL